VAALVARYCPMQTRRLPTHVEAAGATSPDDPSPAGPRTAVIPRDGSGPKGKRPRRHQTFATNVEIKDIFERATPMLPFEAIREPPAGALQRPPSRGLLVIAALGVIALGGAALYAFFDGRDRVLRADALAAPLRSPDASLAVAPPGDAAVQPLVTDAAAPPVVADAGHRDRDAHERPTAAVDAGTPTPPTGTATLKIGANPWGEVYVDGEPKGNTPKELVVRAGHHVVEVVFTGETPPRKQTFAIDAAVGDTKAVEADFK
jgi:hypothetical protein